MSEYDYNENNAYDENGSGQPSGTESSGEENNSAQGTDAPVDGTYHYSYRDQAGNGVNSNMRDEIGSGNRYSYEDRRTETTNSQDGYRSTEPTDSQDGYRRAGSTDTQSEYRRNPYSQTESAGSASRNENRYSYDNDGSSRYEYNGGKEPKKKKGMKVAVIVVCALLIGGVIGVGAWNIGKFVGGSVNSSDQTSVIETAAEPESTQIASAGTSEAADSSDSETSVAATTTSQSSESSGATVTDVSDVVDVALPSVVAITTTQVYEYYNNYGYSPFDYYFGNSSGSDGSSQYETTGAGSGIIIGDDGTELWIVTNNHVVEDSDTLTVSFSDDTTADAYIKGTDSSNDLAVIGVKLENLSDSTKSTIKAVQMGDSDSLRLGEGVIAIGNALGLGQSVSTGCVSALNREITTSEGTTLTTIQTDAAINPGNSGGALLDMDGKLIGINVAKDSDVDVEGMGYAIPISSAKSIIEKLTSMTAKEEVSEDQYPYLGLNLKDIDSSMASAYNMPEGILVYSVEENSPAEEAGILAQDIITAFEGTTVSSYDDLTNELKYYAGGTTVTITVQRLENGSYTEKELSVTLGLKSEYQTSETTAETQNIGNQSGR